LKFLFERNMVEKIPFREGDMKKLWLGVAVVIITILMSGCVQQVKDGKRNYRQDMRDFVKGISAYAKKIRPDFIIIPQNGQELLINEDGSPALDYINAIDGVGREELFYGYNGDDIPTPKSVSNYFISFLNVAKNYGKKVLVIDYCRTPSYVDDSYNKNNALGYISFAADSRELDSIPSYPPTPYNVNSENITSLSEAKNFLYLINPSSYKTKEEFLNAIRATDYDIVIIDLFYGSEQLTPSEVASLKRKANGGSRLVIAYMSIGEAEDYRYYWKPEWKTKPPSWLAEENPNWPGNYKVRYWDKDWQNIIYGYLTKILNAGFDGVYLDIIDAFEYFENR